jgi:hypothetical protein
MQQPNHTKRKKQVAFICLIIAVFTVISFFGYKNFVQPKAQPAISTNGLNSKLPEAEKPKELNKLELYMQAEKDSLARAEQKANDPYMNHLLSEKKNTDSFPRSKQARKARIKEQVKPGEQSAKKSDKRIEEIYN